MAAVNAADQIGYRRLMLLIDFFGSAEVVWKAKETALKYAGLPENALNSLINFRSENPDFPERVAEDCAAKKMNLCTVNDEEYPAILKEIHYPPPILYYRGEIKPTAERIAMVGSRKSTNYGERVAFMISEELATAGITVVSGAAYGIDTCAHRGALKHGRTVAVLGNGLNFKNSNAKDKMLEEIAENGVVMTEFEPNMQPSATTFPPRNRIIAGLSRGTVVVEAGEKSGALITSTFAADQGRDVFAIPGGIFAEMSAGCNKLIRDGAHLIRNAKDIFDYYENDVPEIFEAGQNQLPKPVKKFRKVEEKLFDTEEKTSPKVATKPLPEGKAGEVFAAIPADGFITQDEILMKVDSVESRELPQLLIKLELGEYITGENLRYKRI